MVGFSTLVSICSVFDFQGLQVIFLKKTGSGESVLTGMFNYSINKHLS